MPFGDLYRRQVALLLQRDQRSEPYRSLWLWLTVKDRA